MKAPLNKGLLQNRSGGLGLDLVIHLRNKNEELETNKAILDLFDLKTKDSVMDLGFWLILFCLYYKV